MEIIAVVPAANSNRYSPKGDLVEWGHTSLLEWKISQLKSVSGLAKIVVSTSSDEIAKRAFEIGAQIQMRPAALSLAEIFGTAAEQLPEESHVLWANPTSPFVGSKVFSALIDDYRAAGCPKDGEVTARTNHEYMFVAGEPLGFESESPAFSRVALPTMQALTNGAYLIPTASMKHLKRAFGAKPRFFEVDWLTALEIREAVQMDLFENLIAKYFERET